MVGQGPENTNLLTRKKVRCILPGITMFLAKKAKICHLLPATAAVPWDVKVNNA